MFDLGQLVSHVSAHWHKLMDAKAGFFSAIALALVLGVIAGYLYQAREVAILNARIAQKDDLLVEFREKSQSDTPDAAAAKLRDSEAEIAELKDRELRLIEQKFEENADGTYTISTVMQVVSSVPPAGLCIRVEADGLIEMTVEEVDPQPSVLGSIIQIKEKPDTWYIHSPSGAFLITVHAKSPNGTLHSKFDKRDC